MLIYLAIILLNFLAKKFILSVIKRNTLLRLVWFEANPFGFASIKREVRVKVRRYPRSCKLHPERIWEFFQHIIVTVLSDRDGKTV